MTPPGRGAVDRRRQQGQLQAVQLLDVAGLPSPARLRAPAQRAEPGARHVGEHPGEAAGAPGRPGAVGHHDQRPPVGRVRPDRLPDQHGPVRRDLGGHHGCSRLSGQPGQQRGLAAGAGAEVQPRPRQRRPAGSAPRSTSWEPSSWTPARPARTASRSAGLPRQPAANGERTPGSAPAVDAARRPRPGRAGRPGHRGVVVVGRQRRLELGGRQQVGVRVHDPARMRGPDRQGVADRPARRSAGPASRSGPRRPPSAARR